jgi:anthranilate/para-aminobenzoate synthase component I
MHVRELSLPCEPWSLFRVLASKERPFFIDAGQPWGEAWLSCMGFRPRMQFRVTAADAADAPLETLDALLAALAPARPRGVLMPRRVPFAGGLVLALAYEARHGIERATAVPGEAADAPRLAGGVYDWALAYDHRARRWQLASWHLDARALAAVAEEIRDAAADAARGAGPTPLPMQASTIVAGLDEKAHAARVARIQDYIRAGDAYQVNLTDRFTTRLPAPPSACCPDRRSSSSAGAASALSPVPSKERGPAAARRRRMPRSPPISCAIRRSAPST